MKRISIRIPENLVSIIDRLIELGLFYSRSEFIRYSIREALSELKSIADREIVSSERVLLRARVKRVMEAD